MSLIARSLRKTARALRAPHPSLFLRTATSQRSQMWISVALVAAASLAVMVTVTGPSVPASTDFRVSSPSFDPGDTLPETAVYDGFGCEGSNISPAVAWSGAPDGTRSFAVTLYDPDAPTGSGWWHWVIYNLPTSTTRLEAGAGSGEGLPAEATQGRTDFGSTGYGGPCPPEGDEPHRYVFTVYALDVPNLDLPPDATAARVGFSLNAHALDRATLTGRYGR